MHAMTAPKKEADLVHPLRKSGSVADVTMEAAATLGESVVVKPDLARVGPARHGGAGRVVEIVGAGGATRVAVKYTIGGRIERDIGVERFTHGYPVYQKRPTRAGRKAAPVQPQRSPPGVHPLRHLSLQDALKRACSASRAKGWRRQMHFPGRKGKKFIEKEKTTALMEYKELKGFIVGSVKAGGRSLMHSARKKSSKGKFVVRKAQFDPYVQMLLELGWGEITWVLEPSRGLGSHDDVGV